VYIRMWAQTRNQFIRQKARLVVARKMIECGMRVGDEHKVFVGDVEVDYTALARATGVDRRVVRQTVEQIEKSEKLRSLYSRLSPFGASLVGVASDLGYSVIVIGADPKATGIIATITNVLADHRVVIRQALAEDPDMVPDAKLTLVVEGELAGEVIGRLESLDLVHSITVQK